MPSRWATRLHLRTASPGSRFSVRHPDPGGSAGAPIRAWSGSPVSSGRGWHEAPAAPRDPLGDSPTPSRRSDRQVRRLVPQCRRLRDCGHDQPARRRNDDGPWSRAGRPGHRSRRPPSATSRSPSPPRSARRAEQEAGRPPRQRVPRHGAGHEAHASRRRAGPGFPRFFGQDSRSPSSLGSHHEQSPPRHRRSDTRPRGPPEPEPARGHRAAAAQMSVVPRGDASIATQPATRRASRARSSSTSQSPVTSPVLRRTRDSSSTGPTCSSHASTASLLLRRRPSRVIDTSSAVRGPAPRSRSSYSAPLTPVTSPTIVTVYRWTATALSRSTHRASPSPGNRGNINVSGKTGGTPASPTGRPPLPAPPGRSPGRRRPCAAPPRRHPNPPRPRKRSSA